MPKSELLQLVQTGDFTNFDNRCLELLQEGALRPGELAEPLEALKDAGQQERVKTLAPMVFENVDLEADGAGVIELVKAALASDPKNDDFRNKLIAAYRAAYGQEEGFEAILDASGLTSGRAYRVACKSMDMGLTLPVGGFLVNRMDDRAVEVVEIDRENALFTVRWETRKRTIPVAELARDYDLVSPDDFRVLRQLQPNRLSELIETDPAALVIGLIHAHGDHMDQDQLRDELVPKYLDAKAWSKWWTKARAKLKRNKHIVIEGRNPVFLSYSSKGLTAEDELREAIEAAKNPAQWLTLLEGYLRDKQASKETPDTDALADIRKQLAAYHAQTLKHRPAEALATALVVDRLDALTDALKDPPLALETMQQASDPAGMVAGQDDASFWAPALDALKTARPDEYPELAAQMLGTAPATALDRLAQDALAGGQLSAVQKWIEKALDEPHLYPEIIHWLWKGPAELPEVRLPANALLLEEIINTLLALGRSLNPPADVVRNFRQRARIALGLRDFAKVRACFAATDYGRGVTLKGQLNRLEGIGDTARGKMIAILREVHPELYRVAPKKRLEPWEDPDVIFSTHAGIKAKTAERDDIADVQMRENAKRIGEAASLGDLSENSEYKFALEERDLLRARLAQVNNELSIARPIDPLDVPTERIGIGSRVRLRNSADGGERVMTFVGPFDGDVERGLFNYKAPVSQQLMGREVGAKITIAVDNQNVEYEVMAIENGIADLNLQPSNQPG